MPKRVKKRPPRRTRTMRRRTRAFPWLVAFTLLACAAVLIDFVPRLRLSAPAPREAAAILPPRPRPPPIFVQPREEEPAPPAAASLVSPRLPEAQPAWIRFAAPWPDTGARPRIAIVIDDLGPDHARTERAIALPGAVTLSFLPYSDDLPQLTELARRKGHELLVHVPMEPRNEHIDMGPNGLALDQPRYEVLRRLRWDLDRFDGYVGINNHMGSRFTADPQAMGWVVAELKSRGLMFLDSRTTPNSAGEAVAATEEIPYTARDVFLDDDNRAPAVVARLKEAEGVARRTGTAVAIGHPHEATLAALESWIAGLSREGIVLVPLTDIVKARARIE